MTEAHSRHPRRKIQGKIQRELSDAWPICETLEHAFLSFWNRPSNCVQGHNISQNLGSHFPLKPLGVPGSLSSNLCPIGSDP